MAPRADIDPGIDKRARAEYHREGQHPPEGTGDNMLVHCLEAHFLVGALGPLIGSVSGGSVDITLNYYTENN